MSTWVHRLSDKDTEHRVAICSICGPVDMMRKGRTWHCGNKHREDVRLWMRKKRESEKAPFGVCEICGKHSKLSYDHDHKTGAFRGWLCTKCNTAIGMFDDDTKRLESAIAYLNKQRIVDENVSQHSRRARLAQGISGST